MPKRRVRFLVSVWAMFAAALASAETYYPLTELLAASKTVVGEDIHYPKSGTPRISVAIVTVEPGTQASFHRHPVPLVSYVLEGELTVDYGPHGTKTFREGDTWVEAMEVAHRGINRGSAIVRLLAVYIGAEGSDNVVLQK